MNGRGNFVAAAFALTALTYGLARFAYGLLLPEIRAGLSLGVEAAGWIGGGAFAAYCVGIVFTFVAGGTLGQRRIAVLAGATATCGLALVAVASSGWSLGLAVALAGLSTGLASPPLAATIERSLAAPARPKANGAVNAGTAAGIVFSGIAVLAFAGGWRQLYLLFAVIGATVTLWLRLAMPAIARDQAAVGLPLRRLRHAGVGGLCASAFLMGVASAAIWTFGAAILRDDLGFSSGGIALAWIVLGGAGIVGAGTGILTARFGTGLIHRLAAFAIALALIGLAAARLAPPIAFALLGLFGMAYIVSSGALLLWGIAIFPDRADFGLGLPYLLIALGQTAGAPLFGSVWELTGGVPALLSFAAVAASAAIWTDTAAAREPPPLRSRGPIC